MAEKRARLVRLACALLVWGFVFGPALPYLTTHLIGKEFVDHYGTQWFYWFAQQTIFGNQSPLHTDLLFYPYGKDIYGHTGANLLDAYAAVPFRILLGGIAGYNTFILVGTALTGWAFAKLLAEFIEDKLLVTLFAALFSVNPYILSELKDGRPTQAILILPIFFVLYTLRTGRERTWKNPVLAGVFLALSGYQYWYYAIFGGLFALAHGLALFVRPVEGTGGRLHGLARHAAMAGVSLIIAGPAALPMLLATTGEGSKVPGLLITEYWTMGYTPTITEEGQFIALFLWQPLRGAVGFLLTAGEGYEEFLVHEDRNLYAILPLLALWLWRPGRLRRAPVLSALLLLTFLAMGPVIIFQNTALPNPVAMFLMGAVGFMRRLWWPARTYAFIVILMMLAAGVALDQVRRRFPRAGLAVAAAVMLGWLAELRSVRLAPMDVWSGQVPAGYQCLASGPEGAILEIPFAWTQAHLYYQTVHERPMFGGMIEDNPVFAPTEITKLRASNNFVAAMLDPAHVDRDGPTWTREEMDEIFDLGFRYIVLQKDAFVYKGDPSLFAEKLYRTRLRRMRRALDFYLGKAVYEDARIAIYSPWDTQSPCDPSTLTVDAVATGRTEVGSTSTADVAPPGGGGGGGGGAKAPHLRIRRVIGPAPGVIENIRNLYGKNKAGLATAIESAQAGDAGSASGTANDQAVEAGSIPDPGSESVESDPQVRGF